MKIIAFLLLICFTAATLLNPSQALRRIKRSLPPLANATKVAQDFVELRTREKDNEANLKEEHQLNAAAATAAETATFKEGNKRNSNEFPNSSNREQHQQLVNTNNNDQHFGPKQEQRSLHLGNSALAYLLQNKANRKLNGMTELFPPIDGAINDRGGNAAESVLISSGKGSPFRDMRGSIACNTKKIADLSIGNNNGNSNGNEYSNNDNSNGNANKCGGFNDNNNNNFDIGNNNGNNNMKMSAFESSNYNKNNNYDTDGKSLTEADQLQLENPMHQQQPESATCAAPTQQQQQQQNDQQEKQPQSSGQGPGQGPVVLSISHAGTVKPDSNNLKNPGSHNNANRYEPMENVLKLANILLYKLDNLPPFRTGGTQIFLSPNGNSLPVTLPDTEDFDSIDYLYNNPLDSSINNQHAPIATVTTSPPMPITLPLLPPVFFQSQFALHEPSTQPMNLIETALDKLLVNGVESEDSDGDELELRCPIHHETIKRNGTKGNVKDDIIQVCSCRFFKKKKNT